jgi:hypothetical protein
MKKKSLLLAAVATLGLTAATMAQVPSYAPTNGLVGWWPFNGNANDESGNGNNGTVNGAIIAPDRFGNATNAFSFDGVDDYISTSNSLINNTDFTISLWVKATPLITSTYQCFLYEGVPGEYHMASGATGVYGQLEVGVKGSNNAWVGVYYNLNNSINIWQHFIYVYTNNTIQLYVNGQFYGSAQNNSGGIWSPNLDQSNFGARRVTTSVEYPFNGLLDDIGIWNRALTQQEITDLYNGCQLSVNTQPTNQTINLNNNAQFVVSSSDPSATYQWQTDLGVGFQNLNNVGQYSGTINDTLTVSNVTMTNNNQPFRCIISSGSCTDTSNVAVLTVNNNVGINEFKQDNLFSVYPNPAHSQINVKADATLLGSVYTVYDNTRKVVLSGKINSENTVIELGNLSGGIYLFSVGENLKQTFKVIKE